MRRSISVLILGALCFAARSPAAAQRVRDFPEGEVVLRSWFDRVQRDELDSLPALLAPDFTFVGDGERFTRDGFVAMIKSLGIHHPRVELSKIVGHRSEDSGYLIYDRTESFESRGAVKTVPETGTMVLARRHRHWVIVLWTTTEPAD